MIPSKESRIIETLNSGVQEHSEEFSSKIDEYRQALIERGAYTLEDPQDMSIIPRVITKSEHQEIEQMCQELTQTCFGVLSDYLSNPSTVPSSPMNDFIKTLPTTQRVLSGMARYDFLKQGLEYKLVETNFVNPGALIESTGSAETVLKIFPDLRKSLYSIAPVNSAKRRLIERGVKNLLILTRDSYEDCPSEVTDRHLIKNTVLPIHAEIVPQAEYGRISVNGSIEYGGKTFDGVYPKHLSGSSGMEDELLNYKEFVSSLLRSNAVVFDNWLTMLLEEKDLRFLSRQNPSIAKYLPQIRDFSEMQGEDYSDWVLKLRDTHCGRGVVIAPESVDTSENGIMQQRIYTNKHPVVSLSGKSGNATFDTGVYVSYCFDLDSHRLLNSEVAGYLTRFSITSDIVNMTQGGGVIPTLIEK